MTVTEPPHITRIMAVFPQGMRATCDCGFIGTLYYDHDMAWQQAVEHEIQNMGPV